MKSADILGYGIDGCSVMCDFANCAFCIQTNAQETQIISPTIINMRNVGRGEWKK